MKEFLGASTGPDGYVKANYLEDGYLTATRYVAMLDKQQPSQTETHYSIYQLQRHTITDSGFFVVINGNVGTAYVHKQNTDIPWRLAQRFVNLITGMNADIAEETEDWFEFAIAVTEYR